MFWYIEAFTLTLQILLIQFGGAFVRCSPLTFSQHVTCIVVASSSLGFAVLIKSIPDAIFNRINLFSEKELKDLNKMNLVNLLRKPSSVRLGVRKTAKQLLEQGLS